MSHSTRRAPTISIITAVYNGAKTLEATLESTAMQLGTEAEHIVIDGGSNDGTLEIIEKYAANLAYWISEPDNGIYNAWNKGLARARGQYIAFIGADDVAHDNYISSYLHSIHEQPEIEYWSSRVLFNSRPPRHIGKPWRWEEFRRYMTVAHVGSMHKRSLYERYGSYDESFRITADYEFLLRPGASLRAGFIDAVTVTMGADGTSNKNFSAALKEAHRAKIMCQARGRAAARLDHWIATAKCLLHPPGA